jgi:hypothetical protein
MLCDVIVAPQYENLRRIKTSLQREFRSYRSLHQVTILDCVARATAHQGLADAFGGVAAEGTVGATFRRLAASSHAKNSSRTLAATGRTPQTDCTTHIVYTMSFRGTPRGGRGGSFGGGRGGFTPRGGV